MKNVFTKAKKLTVFLLVAMVFLSLAACRSSSKTDELWTDALYTADTELGTGAKKLQVQVKVNEKSVKLLIHTDKKTVGDALTEQKLIEGEPGDYGLYIKKVNGITADYDKDQHYWAFYIGDEYAMSGVDTTEIEESSVYRLVYSK